MSLFKFARNYKMSKRKRVRFSSDTKEYCGKRPIPFYAYIIQQIIYNNINHRDTIYSFLLSNKEFENKFKTVEFVNLFLELSNKILEGDKEGIPLWKGVFIYLN